jgi:hypothetical protein
MPATDADIDKIILMLTSGASRASIAEAATAKMNLPPAVAKAAMAEARRRLTLAARYNRDQALGVAISRLETCYSRSMAIQDVKTAVACQRELNKLMGLYQTPAATAETVPNTAPSRDAVLARKHLAALALAGGETATLAELCRLAVARIIELESRPAAAKEPA